MSFQRYRVYKIIQKEINKLDIIRQGDKFGDMQDICYRRRYAEQCVSDDMKTRPLELRHYLKYKILTF